MEEREKILKIFKDFEPFDTNKVDDSFKFVNISTKNYNPPAYIVQILFLEILGFKNYGRMDKVLWHTYFRYKNYPFMIRDYKFGSWSIEGIKNNKENIQLVKEIQNKIIKASRILDKILYKELKHRIEKGDFYLNNVYNKLFSIYKFYEKKVLKTVRKIGKLEKEKKESRDISYFIKKLNIKLTYEKILSNYTFALILSYFSLLEFLLDVIYIFERPSEQFFEFRKKKWKDKFKLVFPTNNKEIKYLFDDLITIKTNYRNPLAHGLTNEIGLMVPLLSVGLIPLSYEYLYNKIHYDVIEIGKSDTLKIVKIFKRFLKFIEKQKPYKFYLLYLKYGFPIPVNLKEICEIKKEMITYKSFKKYLEARADYECMIINRDI